MVDNNFVNYYNPCPDCNSPNLTFAELAIDIDATEVTVLCMDCGSEWTDIVYDF